MGVGLYNLTFFLSKSVNVYKWPYQTAWVHSVTWKRAVRTDCPSACRQIQRASGAGLTICFIKCCVPRTKASNWKWASEQVSLFPWNQFDKICILKFLTSEDSGLEQNPEWRISKNKYWILAKVYHCCLSSFVSWGRSLQNSIWSLNVILLLSRKKQVDYFSVFVKWHRCNMVWKHNPRIFKAETEFWGCLCPLFLSTLDTWQI